MCLARASAAVSAADWTDSLAEESVSAAEPSAVAAVVVVVVLVPSEFGSESESGRARGCFRARAPEGVAAEADMVSCLDDEQLARVLFFYKKIFWIILF